MRKLPFVLVRLAATLVVVASCYFFFKLDPIYLTIVGIVAYAVFDFFGYSAFNLLKRILKKAPDGSNSSNQPSTSVKPKAKAAAKKSGGSPKVHYPPDEISGYLSLNRRLDFIIYFDAPAKSAHQVLMWIPFLSALRRNYVIVLRSKTYQKTFLDYCLPVVVLPSLADLGKVVEAGVKYVFYVNNGMRNTHMVRYNELTHIQLLHGDSDKPASYNPISVMYDHLFVAGTMAIDRYANNNVRIPDEKFVVVGRPQSEDLVKISSKTDLSKKKLKTVLYTTTWSGFQEDTNFSSILSAKEIVERLVNMGCRVIFRPHPNSFGDRNQAGIIDEIRDYLLEETASSGVGHCISNIKEFGFRFKSASSCMNAADILISDISSMISDWLYSAKPYIMLDKHKDKDAFVKNNPLAKGGYYADLDLSEFEDIIGLAAMEDPMWDERLEVREYALGLTLDEEPLEKFLMTTNELLHSIEKEIGLRE